MTTTSPTPAPCVSFVILRTATHHWQVECRACGSSFEASRFGDVATWADAHVEPNGRAPETRAEVREPRRERVSEGDTDPTDASSRIPPVLH